MIDINRFNRFYDAIYKKCCFASYDYRDKDNCIAQHNLYNLMRLQSMFEWSGLPDTVPAYMLETYLMTAGVCAWTRVDGVDWVFTGGLGGEPNPYYQPTIFTVANPALNYSRNLQIGAECVLIKNDPYYIGLLPLLTRYATGLVENELTLDIATKHSRIISLISAPDDSTKKAGEKYLSDIEDGKSGVIAENAFLDGIRATPYGNSGSQNRITALIELEQYYKASLYNELGLNANYNMKRETITQGESQLNNDVLLPLVDTMLRERQEAAKRINEKYGYDISVDFSSAWKDNVEELEAVQKALEAAADPEEVEEAPETVEEQKEGDEPDGSDEDS